MTGREFLFLMTGVLISNALHAKGRTQATKQAPTWDEGSPRAFRDHPLLIPSYLCLGWAAWLAWIDLYILYRLAFWNDPWEASLYVFIPGLAMVSALSALIGLVLRDESLPRRMGRTWAAAVGAFRGRAPVKPKAKPDRSAYDLD